MKNVKRGIGILTAFLLVLSFVSCHGKADSEAEKIFTGENVFKQTGALDLGFEREYNVKPKVSGEDIFYFVNYIPIPGEEVGVTCGGWVFGKTDGTHGELIMKETGIKEPGNHFEDAWYDGKDTVYLIEYVKEGNKKHYDLVSCSKEGEELSREMIEGTDQKDYLTAFSSDGIVVIVNDAEFHTFDLQNKKLASGSAGAGITAMVAALGDGKIAVAGTTGAGDMYVILDPKTGTADQKHNLTIHVNNPVFGAGSDFYAASKDGIYRMDPATGEEKMILDFEGSDLTSDAVSSGYVMDEDMILLIVSENPQSSSGGRPYIFTRMNPDAVLQKQVITVGGIYLNTYPDLLNYLTEFNRQDDKYRIVTKDYYEETGTLEEAKKRFRNDLLTGEAPDIIIPNPGDNPLVYLNRGVFEDLTPYMEKAGISKDDYLENVIEAGSAGDQLYIFIPRFMLGSTCITKKQYVNENGGLSIRNLADLEKQMGIEGHGYYPWGVSDIIQDYIMNSSDVFYNVKTGECNFDGEDFMDFLEWSGKYSSDFSTSNEGFEEPDLSAEIAGNKCIAEQGDMLYNFRNMYHQDIRDFNGEGEFIGIPSADGSKPGCIEPYLMLAISGSSENKEAAFEIVSRFMGDEFQTERTVRRMEHFFASKKSAFDLQYEWAMEDPYVYDYELGIFVQKKDSYTRLSDHKAVEIPNVPEEKLREYKDYVLSCKGLPQYDFSVYNIVAEETAPYYKGKKSARKVADTIQNRVKNYVGENYSPED